jgi:hypothetical protein
VSVIRLKIEHFKAVFFLTYTVQLNVKFTLEQTTKSQRGSRGIILLFL